MLKYRYVWIVSGILLFGCKEKAVVFEDNKSIEEGIWKSTEPIKLTFEIYDTSKIYNLYYNIRNEEKVYPYHNLYVTYYLRYPDGKKVDSLLQDILLFDPKTGEPYGQGTAGIKDHQLPAFQKFKFPQKGVYRYEFRQYMRVEQLKGILSMGVCIKDAQIESQSQ